MMGMANIEQISHGIQLRLFSRCFVIADAPGTTRVAFISADMAFVPGGVTEAVMSQLNTYYNGKSPFSFANVMISATHTHSGPGGYCMYNPQKCTCVGCSQALVLIAHWMHPTLQLLKRSTM
jgi:neutral ceramidase